MGTNIKLTKTEQEVLHLLANEFLTPKQVSIRRKTNVQAVYKIMKRLQDKGFYSKGKKIGTNMQSSITLNVPNKIRLHAQEFNINILYKDQRYKERQKKSQITSIDGNTIRLYRDSIEIYSGQSFYADDAHKATSKSFAYWNRFFIRLENELNIIIVKPRSQNIRLVNHHYAEVNNELAEECEKKGYKISVYTREDGKLWFKIDNSFNLHEAESLHPETAKQDMEKIKEHFNDVRDKEHIPLSEISLYIADTSKQVNEISYGLKAVVNFIKSQLPNGDSSHNEDENETPDYMGG